MNPREHRIGDPLPTGPAKVASSQVHGPHDRREHIFAHRPSARHRTTHPS
jgi:hypothetical protein